jgi:3-deoxy-D-arabino-heptulosonate 7-phosphate (DAHP) synthase
MVMAALHRFMMDHFTMESGIWMPCTAKESFSGTSENAHTKEHLKMGREQEKEFTKRVLKHILDRLKMDNSMEKADMYSITQNHTKKITWSSMKVNLKTIKS